MSDFRGQSRDHRQRGEVFEDGQHAEAVVHSAAKHAASAVCVLVPQQSHDQLRLRPRSQRQRRRKPHQFNAGHFVGAAHAHGQLQLRAQQRSARLHLRARS